MTDRARIEEAIEIIEGLLAVVDESERYSVHEERVARALAFVGRSRFALAEEHGGPEGKQVIVRDGKVIGRQG